MSPSDSPSTAPASPLVALRDAEFGYHGRPIVDGVTLSIVAGEIVALLGANGSGKSTLIRGLVGLSEHLGGDASLFGTPLGELTQRWRVGYIPQHIAASGSVPTTVEEVVASGRLARTRLLGRMGRLGHADRQAIARAIEIVSLTQVRHRPFHELSGGQQRRGIIARALASEPELLLLDEPTAGVDYANQVALAATLGELAAAGTTLVLVTHELGPVEGLVTRAIELQRGRVVVDGPPQPHDDAHHHEHGSEHDHVHGEPPHAQPSGLLGWRQ